MDSTYTRRAALKGAAAGLWALTVGAAAHGETRRGGKPNIVFILSDDQGWNGLSVRMHPDRPDSRSDYYRTPNLQRLAARGLRFTDAYAPAPMCTPSRASFLTGKTPARLRMTTPGRSRKAREWEKLIQGPSSPAMPAGETTIGEILSRSGYATAYFGKWHLGTAGPEKHGFDVSDGATGNEDGNTADPANPKDIFGITKRGSDFMEKSVKAGRPFYVQLWHYAVHDTLQSLQKTASAVAERAEGKVHSDPGFAAATEDLDTGVGMILKKIEDLGIANNTYVVYMSDNGAGARFSPNTPLAKGKGSLWEGGIRVPLIIAGPGVEAGMFRRQRVAGWDLFPTFCDMAGVREKLPADLDGGSLKPLLASNKGVVKRPRDETVFHFPHYGHGKKGATPHSAIFMGDYKLVKLYETDEVRLFNLSKDIGEADDLAKRLPDRADTMRRRLESYLQHVDAATCKPNPDYDPDAPVRRMPPPGGRRRETRPRR